MEMMTKVEETYAGLRDLEREIGEKMKDVDLKAGQFAITRPFGDLFKKYSEHPEITSFLEGLKGYTLTKLDLFQQAPAAPQVPVPAFQQPDSFMAYRINVFVDNSSASGPPIIIEPNPNCSERLKERR